MLNLVTPIQETKAYQSIFAEGEIKDEAKGKAQGLVECHDADGRAFGHPLAPLPQPGV